MEWHGNSGNESNLPHETTPKFITLENKLAEDHEFDVIGILNLSEMKLTDQDIPSIVQRAIREQKNVSVLFCVIMR